MLPYDQGRVQVQDWDDGIIVVMFKDRAGTEMVTAS